MSGWPDDEMVLARFRQWLEQTHAEADATAGDGGPLGGPPELPPVGLYQLVEEFTALRHEAKLLTKSARGLDDRTVQTLEAMQAAIAEFRSVEAKEREAAYAAGKPLVEALVDLHDALERGRTVIETARRRILDESPGELQLRLDELLRNQPWWQRWVFRPFREAVRQACARHAAEADRAVFESLVEGYGLIQNRLAKAMDREGILRIECLGRPVDPTCMTVVEVVDDPTRPPGLVVEVVRPGYYWRSKVFRFAEVRAVQARSGERGIGSAE